MILKRIQTVVILWAAASACLLAATRYVSHSGSNAFPYTTWETAANTIEAANLATLPGDTMLIDTGSFYLSAPVYTQPKITMRGKGMDSTRVLGSEAPELLHSVMFLPEDSNLIEDLHFVGSGSHYAFIKSATDPDRSLFFTSCRFSDFASSTLACGNNRHVAVINCIFETWNDFALFLTDRGDYVIENNTFYMPDAINEFANFIGNTGSIVLHKNVFVGGGWTGIQGGSGRIDVRNNLFYRNRWLELVQITAASDVVFAQNSFFLTHNDFGRANDILVLYLDELDTCLIYNNVFAGYQPRLVFNASVTNDPMIKITYNCFYAVAPFGQEEHIWVPNNQRLDSLHSNVFADPMFVDPWNGDLRLQKGSPCIDAGAPWILDVDGTRSDIGAFGGPDGEFYIYQDLPPKAPASMMAWRDSNRVILSWERNSESDFLHYVLFRTTEPGAPLDSQHVLTYLDPLGRPIRTDNHKEPLGFDDDGKYFDPERYIPMYAVKDLRRVYYVDWYPIDTLPSYYTLVAVDSSGLVSAASTVQVSPPQAVGHPVSSGVGNPFPTPDSCCQEGIHDSASLEPNYPNPFNATTALVYNLPSIGAQPAPVHIEVFNILGQRVKTLVDTRQLPGRHTIYWDGTNEQGELLSSGVYFCRLEVSGIEFVKSGKMILMK
ncbi:MAG: right-handed parallel beta-helix repeat-containing protein [candidate division Zixibacteria bacterium]|nr:right-handed parallel beta-helix repeat-containing protein [candidate division Zixibacteria bacterium]